MENVCDVMTAKEWLYDYLSNHSAENPAEVSMIMAAGKSAGYSRKELREAKRELGVITTNNWNKETGVASEWYWTLPEAEK